MAIDITGFNLDVTEGKPAPKTIRSPRFISFVDVRKTNALRNVEKAKISPVYTTIYHAEDKILARYEKFSKKLSDFYYELRTLPLSQPPQNLIASYFNSDSLIEPEKLIQLRSLQPSQVERLIASAKRMLLNINQKIITSQNLVSIKDKAEANIRNYPEDPIFKLIMEDIVKNSIMVNAIEDEKRTRLKREAAANSIQPVKRVFQKGQKIIDEGSIVSSDDYYVIKQIEKQLHKNRILSFSGHFLLALIVLVLSLIYLKLNHSQILKDAEQYRLLGSLFLVTLALAKIGYVTGGNFVQTYMPVLFNPLPSVALLMCMLLNTSVAMFHIVLLSLLIFILAGSNSLFVVVGLLGGITGILAWQAASKEGNVRELIGLSGLKIGFVSTIAIFGFLLIDTENFSSLRISQILKFTGFGMINGILSAILANGVLPYMEKLFSLATDSKLLELTELSQPLLKRLSEEAPGTYQHSIGVATLSEAAANAIGADPLLTKAAAYYHDIGKLKRPLYFAENQEKGENQHDKVNPYMSSLILVGHIRDGLDLGREYELPERLLSVMSQHHGTTLISYFFEEAKKNTDSEEVNEGRFRYPGPKPQTREAAIIMLADSVEAAARTLEQHTHTKIDSLVSKIVEHKLNDENQLDESDLTLKDIEKIEQMFVKVISSMYHGRIDYPGKLSNKAVLE